MLRMVEGMIEAHKSVKELKDLDGIDRERAGGDDQGDVSTLEPVVGQDDLGGHATQRKSDHQHDSGWCDFPQVSQAGQCFQEQKVEYIASQFTRRTKRPTITQGYFDNLLVSNRSCEACAIPELSQQAAKSEVATRYLRDTGKGEFLF
ncbi:uncharacterized protein CIMG_13608 [Coccidioides immitis RS]|uniref:Uncharacterized protein n=1 Tax=Coccidioides immitis (strain RS) TaxID=246410 RepID=A0A0D8JVL3_COCIM|nr:uncharacterized protein CIMG_13608 [Coccidioides immitis RS]KJF61370.1 hypothetical protein CIMG_13608 [Coccidioides immitis RS]